MSIVFPPNLIQLGGGNVTVNADGSISLAPAGSTNVTLASGQLLLPDGTVSAPACSFSGGTGIGWYRNLNNVHLAYSGVRRLSLDLANNATAVSADGTIAWSNTSGDASTTRDVILARDAAATLAQRNGANAQARRLYNTYTDASNGEWHEQSWAGNVCTLKNTKNGTGTLRGLNVGSAITDLLGFYGATPITQPAGAGQAAITDSTGGTASTTFAAITAGAAYAQADMTATKNALAQIAVSLNALRTTLVNLGLEKGAA